MTPQKFSSFLHLNYREQSVGTRETMVAPQLTSSSGQFRRHSAMSRSRSDNESVLAAISGHWLERRVILLMIHIVTLYSLIAYYTF